MDDVHKVLPDLAPRIRLISEADPLAATAHGLIDHLPSYEMDSGRHSTGFNETAEAALTIGLIDSYRFTREYLGIALADLQPNATIFPFDTVEACAAASHKGFDLIIFYSHNTGVSDTAAMQKILTVSGAVPNIPLIVLSDAEDAQQLKTVCNTLKCGAQGIIATRTTGISIASAAIRLVRAGGTFAPIDMLLTNRPDRTPTLPDAARLNRLTSRQTLVLSHIQRGHANKTIAHQLSMSESTVKVHVRNIMRKLGATNRTQAVYKSQKMWDGVIPARGADA